MRQNDLGDLRREYAGAEVHKYELAADPIEQFQTWFAEACASPSLEPNAMALATVAANGQPSLRTVLLKYFGADGFVFFTNLESTKAREMELNPRVALLFTWLALERQVIIKGTAARISSGESLKYFLSRPRGSQIGAWVSRQSSVISSRHLLESKFDEMRRKFREGTIPMPSFWGGYRVEPAQIEFWQGGPNRLHDRFQYTRLEDRQWVIERLAP